MTSIEDARQLSIASDELTRRARADLNVLWPQMDLTNYKLAEAGLTEAMQAITDHYGSIVATIAADWYEALRSEADAPGVFAALVQPPPAPAQVASATHYAVNQGLWLANPDNTLSLLLQILDHLVKQAARETILESLNRDPSGPRYARVPMGLHPCAFCRMLASRGYAYASAQTASQRKDGNRYHDDCHCFPIPQWGPGAIDGFDERLYRIEYDTARDAAKSGDPKAILAQMRQNTRENQHHYGLLDKW